MDSAGYTKRHYTFRDPVVVQRMKGMGDTWSGLQEPTERREFMMSCLREIRLVTQDMPATFDPNRITIGAPENASGTPLGLVALDEEHFSANARDLFDHMNSNAPQEEVPQVRMFCFSAEMIEELRSHLPAAYARLEQERKREERERREKTFPYRATRWLRSLLPTKQNQASAPIPG